MNQKQQHIHTPKKKSYIFNIILRLKKLVINFVLVLLLLLLPTDPIYDNTYCTYLKLIKCKSDTEHIVNF